jgi:hypothetical protein
MKLPIISILSGVALATFSGVAQAAIVVPPTGLAPGSEYRLVFVTSGTRNGTSSNIADYNTFVQNAARSSSVLNTALTTAGFDPTSISWTAIASTPTTNARVNTQTQATDTSRPIYRLDGALIATSYADLWDGSLRDTLNVTEVDSVGAGRVWTGTAASGLTLGALGSAFSVLYGIQERIDLWVSNGDTLVATNGLNLYGISSVLAVPTATATTPEPSSLLGFITLGGLLLGGAARKARK